MVVLEDCRGPRAARREHCWYSPFTIQRWNTGARPGKISGQRLERPSPTQRRAPGILSRVLHIKLCRDGDSGCTYSYQKSGLPSHPVCVQSLLDHQQDIPCPPVSGWRHAREAPSGIPGYHLVLLQEEKYFQQKQGMPTPNTGKLSFRNKVHNPFLSSCMRRFEGKTQFTFWVSCATCSTNQLVQPTNHGGCDVEWCKLLWSVVPLSLFSLSLSVFPLFML